jgi:hypothetical protein
MSDRMCEKNTLTMSQTGKKTGIMGTPHGGRALARLAVLRDTGSPFFIQSHIASMDRNNSEVKNLLYHSFYLYPLTPRLSN